MMDFREEKDFMIILQAQKLMRQLPFENKFTLNVVLSGFYEPQLNYRKPSTDTERIESLRTQDKIEVETIEVDRDTVLKMVQQFELLGSDFMPSYCIVPVVRKIVADEIVESKDESEAVLATLNVPHISYDIVNLTK